MRLTDYRAKDNHNSALAGSTRFHMGWFAVPLRQAVAEPLLLAPEILRHVLVLLQSYGGVFDSALPPRTGATE